MRKDYIADPSAGMATEAELIERQWTEQWRRRGVGGARPNLVPLRRECRIMAPYLKRLPPGARLLDGGCGLGEWTVYFTGAGYRVLGLDISREIIAALRESHPDAEFRAGDIRATGLPMESFDAYFTWGTFEHFQEGLRECIVEALRILKPGGYLFATVPFDNLRLAWTPGANHDPEPNAEAGATRFYQWRLTRAELHDELTAGGFEVLDIRMIHKRQGIVRLLNQTLGLPWQSLVTRSLGIALAPFVPAKVFAHMLMGVARKPVDHANRGGRRDNHA